MALQVNNIFTNMKESSPYMIQEGVFGAAFNKDKETLFLRMELLTEKNVKSWRQFQEMTTWVANSDDRGVLSGLVSLAGEDAYPQYENIKDTTGFTKKEYIEFTEKAINLKNKNQNKIEAFLSANSVGSRHMCAFLTKGEFRYIIYISKKHNFSIQDVADMTDEKINLKNYIKSYEDILIVVGSDFSAKEDFHNRGIFRNPYWVFEEKYSGLSMLLHGFAGAVAGKYFPEKKFMTVKPVGRMQSIIKKQLLPEEGYVTYKDTQIDITNLNVSSNDPEGEMNWIKISALSRIYNQTITGFNNSTINAKNS